MNVFLFRTAGSPSVGIFGKLQTGGEQTVSD